MGFSGPSELALSREELFLTSTEIDLSTKLRDKTSGIMTRLMYGDFSVLQDIDRTHDIPNAGLETLSYDELLMHAIFPNMKRTNDLDNEIDNFNRLFDFNTGSRDIELYLSVAIIICFLEKDSGNIHEFRNNDIFRFHLEYLRHFSTQKELKELLPFIFIPRVSMSGFRDRLVEIDKLNRIANS